MLLVKFDDEPNRPDEVKIGPSVKMVPGVASHAMSVPR